MFLLSAFSITILLSAQGGEISNRHVKLNKSVTPFDLEDEVRGQLEQLRLVVEGDISAAFDSLYDLNLDVYYYREDAFTEAQLRIQQEYESLKAEITTLKDLALAAGQNVDVCLENNESFLDFLPQYFKDILSECFTFANKEITIIMNEARYRIDILINEVHIFEFQIDMCASEFLCIEPLVTRIELAMVDIPQRIGLRLQEVSDLFTTLKLSIKDCMNARVSQFVIEASTLVANATACVNGIII